MKISEKIKKNKLLVLVVLVYIALLVFLPETAIKAFNNSTYYLLEMVQVLPVIFILTVVIEAWIPKEVIMKHFGENSGFKGNLYSLVLGSLSAGPIYAAFPLSKMLLGKGASIANIVIILSSWAVIKVPMLANEAKFLGAGFMALRWVLTVIAIFGMAYIINKLVKKEDMGIEHARSPMHIPEVMQEYCTGCTICTKLAPEVFEMRGNKAWTKTNLAEGHDSKLIRKAVDMCPSKAIAYEDSRGPESLKTAKVVNITAE